MRDIKLFRSILLIISLILITSCSKNSLNKYVSDNGLTIKSYESYADHYSNTLSIWRDEFNKKWNQIKNQGFDLTFKRMWEFYLCYCEAGFKSKNIDLIQFSIQNK